jgi:hypothetical protein
LRRKHESGEDVFGGDFGGLAGVSWLFFGSGSPRGGPTA